MRTNYDSSDGPDVPEWWDEVENIVVLHRWIRIGVSQMPDERLEQELTDEELEAVEKGNLTSVAIEAGEELPLEAAEKCWSGFNDRLAAFDEEGERLDNPSRAERHEFSPNEAGLVTEIKYSQ